MKVIGICGCGYRKRPSTKEAWTTCPACGDNTNWDWEVVQPEA